MATHPLEPLTSEEVQLTVQILRHEKITNDRSRIVLIVLQEPPKEFVLKWRKGDSFPRVSDVTLLDNDRKMCVEVRVCLRSKKVLHKHDVPGVQPSITIDEMGEAEKTILANEDFKAKVFEHYGPDAPFENIGIDVWSAGYYGDESEFGTRLAKPIPFFKDPRSNNPFAYPIEGIRPVIDLNGMKVIKIVDYGKYPLPPEHFSFFRTTDLQEQLRKDVKPLDVLQKEGPSFKVDGRFVEWQKWSFVIGFNGKEAMTIHDVRYDQRPVLFRGSIADMVIPYGDTSHQQARKNAFDIGEYGIGIVSGGQPLRAGHDAIGEVHFFDGELVTSRGLRWTIKDVVCMREEDYGVLWKHFDRHSGQTEVRRSRRLVASFFCSVENYDYQMSWIFYQDGTIEFESNLTGFLSLGAWADEENYPKYGNLMAPGLYAPNHQHILCARLDFAVDGVSNRVSQVDVVPDSKDNKGFRNGFCAKKTLFAREMDARSLANTESSRTWDISSTTKINSLGQPTAYRLLPRSPLSPYADAGAWWRKRAAFSNFHLWVTHFEDQERYPAGKYPNQAPADHGLIKWTERNREIDGKDCVVWHVFGVTHIPRPEDYPVMPVAFAGFALKPFGFFDRNPAFDVPPQTLVNKNITCHAKKSM